MSRYDNMKYKNVGDSGLKLPLISLGLWHNFGNSDVFANMKEICFETFDQGITHFDLANNYGRPEEGSAEENFGRILKNHLSSYRDEMIISTKAGYLMWDGPYGDGGSRKYLISSLNQSLKRLDLEYVDIFYHHRMDKSTPLYETMIALNDIVKSGKALYIGLSNYDGPTMKEASKILKELNCPFIINQNRYSMLDNTIHKNGLRKESIDHKKGIIAFCPLEQGILAGKYLNGIPTDSRVKSNSVFLNEDSLTKEKLDKVAKLAEIAKDRNQSMAQMALAWTLHDESVTSVLIGASRKEQVIENAKTLENLEFTKDEVNKIEKILG